ncbi:MAG: WHG domain-containing protein [Myxococcales bacterium]|nr:WHG domain-containing protein [Myxococcales bacterium]
MKEPAKRKRAKSAPRSDYHHGDLANALVQTTLEIVEASGAEGFSLRDATERCGVAVSSAYKHFATRSALLLAVSDLGFEALCKRIDARVARATRGLSGVAKAEATLVELGRTYILFALDRPHLFRLMYGSAQRDDRREARPAAEVARKLVAGIDEVLRERGQDRSELSTHKVVAWSLVHGFAVMALDGLWQKRGRELDAMIDALGAAMLRSLR